MNAGDIVRVSCRDGASIVLGVYEKSGHEYVSLFDAEKNMYFLEMTEEVFKTGKRININELPQTKVENLRRKHRMVKAGDKFIIEIGEIFKGITTYGKDENGSCEHNEKLYRIKGFGSIVFNEEELNMLERHEKQVETINGNKVHLCTSCEKTYPECDCKNILFGDGTGNDNICCCDAYACKGQKKPEKEFLRIVVTGTAEKTYYTIDYLEDGEEHNGYGSYNLDDVLKWKEEEFCAKKAEEEIRVGGWISCSEKLPEPFDNVLVSTKEGGRTIGYRCPNQKKGRFYDLHMAQIDGVIAWRPLPKPYETEKEMED